MAKKQDQNDDSHKKAAAALFVLSLLLSLSLFSFSYHHPESNYLGPIGYLLAGLLYHLFGLLAPLLLSIIFLFALHSLLPSNGEEELFSPLSFIPLFLALALTLTAAGKLFPSLMDLFDHSDFLGGSLSHLAYHTPPLRYLTNLLSREGALLLFISLFMVALFYQLPSQGKETTVQSLLHALQRLMEGLVFLGHHSFQFLQLLGRSLIYHSRKLFSSLHRLTQRTQRPVPSIVIPTRSMAKLDSPKEESPPPSNAPATITLPLLTRAKPLQTAHTPLLEPSEEHEYLLPPIELLLDSPIIDHTLLEKDLHQKAATLEETLRSFQIEAKVTEINCGPTIISFELQPAVGVKVQKITTLANDIALNMKAKSIRIIAPIPGKAAVGIEVPNPKPQPVGFKEILAEWKGAPSKERLPLLLGRAVNGEKVIADLAKMPHCIIAGATGAGKSVCINSIVMSLIYLKTPSELRLVMVDPKKVELTPYTTLPHMLAPVITEPKGAINALKWLVREMEIRYEWLKITGVRNIEGFNQRTIDTEVEDSSDNPPPRFLPYIVCIIDELADLMMVSSQEIETPIARIAQMARAVGIHLILATQRPSREVITGLIKANFPTRIAFKVASRVNSQIILDAVGAEVLLGNGDLLFLPPQSANLIRAQGAFVADREIQAAIDFVKQQSRTNYLIPSFEDIEEEEVSEGTAEPEGRDEKLYERAKEIVIVAKSASATMLQNKLKIGYPTAARMINLLEERGVISPSDRGRARKVLL